MALFEATEIGEPWKVYRPSESAKTNPRAWWRYSILSEAYKVRCFQRAETWRLAGNRGMNLLSHIRVLVAQHGSLDGVDLNGISDSYLNDTAGKLRALEHVVEDLNRENMTLRKLIKALLTPVVKEGLADDPTTMQYIESQVARFDHYTKFNSPKKADSPRSPRQHSDFATVVVDAMEAEKLAAEDRLINTIISEIESPDLKLRSPYENQLPPIEHTERDMREPPRASKKGKPASLKAPKPKPVNEKDKFPSYLEREAQRKEAAKHKREQIILRKAEELLQSSAAVDNAEHPTMFLPILPVRLSPRGAPPSRSPSSAAGLEQNSPADSALTEKGPSQKSAKPLVQPAWVDDFKVVDPLIGRGKGRAREDKGPTTEASSRMGSKNSSRAQGIGDVSAPASKVLSAEDVAGVVAKQKVVYPHVSADMSQGEKVTVELISKARAKVLTVEEAKRPLSNTEKALLKSPLALPLVKPQAGDQALSPRSKFSTTVHVAHVPASSPALAAPSPAKPSPSPSPRIPGSSAKKSPRSPQKTPLSSRAVVGAGSSAALESQSAPATVSNTTTTAVTVTAAPGTTGTLPAFTPTSSPSKDAVSVKKKNILKMLNEKSNPNSPRLEMEVEPQTNRVVMEAVERSLAQSFSAASIEAALSHLKLPVG